jgi:hypothetical protein
MSGHLWGVLEPSVVLQVNCDAGRPPGVTSDGGEKNPPPWPAFESQPRRCTGLAV